MSPRSSSRSYDSRRSYSKTPSRQCNGRRRTRGHHSRHCCNSRSRTTSNEPTSTMPKRSGRYSGNSRSSSRSLSPRHHHRRITRSRSRSRSNSRSSRDSSDKRGTRERPMKSKCIGVFGLSVYTTQQKIREIFSKFGPIDRIQVVIDAQTGRSRGFCFIYYEQLQDAKIAKNECSGLEIDGRRIRVDYSITSRPHTPTPGIYMGRPTKSYRDRENHDRQREEHRPSRRSSSHHNRSSYKNKRRRYERSCSRSHTPRRSRY